MAAVQARPRSKVPVGGGSLHLRFERDARGHTSVDVLARSGGADVVTQLGPHDA
jgi:hypothetical protein